MAAAKPVEGDVHVLDDLEVVHSHTHEIGAVLKSVLDTFPGIDRPDGQRLECDPRLLDGRHERDGFVRLLDAKARKRGCNCSFFGSGRLYFVSAKSSGKSQRTTCHGGPNTA
jgi:hypothetical protein